MRKHLISTATLLALATTAVTAQAFDFPIKIPTLGKSKPAAAAKSGGGGTTSPAASSSSKFGKLSEEEIATLALKEILGEAHKTTTMKPYFRGGPPEAQGTFVYTTKADGEVLRKRVDAMVEKEIGQVDGEFRKAFNNRYCEEKVKKFEGLSGKEIDEMCADFSKYASGPFEHELTLRDAVRVPILAKAIKDEKVRKDYLNRFASTLGHTREAYQWKVTDDQYDTMRGVNLKETALDTWSFRTVRYAARWAKDNNADADVVAKLEAALPKAPKIRCAKEPGWFYREYEGGSTYGELKFNQNYVHPEVVDCAEAKMKTDPAHIAALPKPTPRMGRSRYLAVQPEEQWRVYNNDYGQIAGKAMNVTIYFEQEY